MNSQGQDTIGQQEEKLRERSTHSPQRSQALGPTIRVTYLLDTFLTFVNIRLYTHQLKVTYSRDLA